MPVSVKPAVQKVCASEERRHAQARDAAGGNCETNESRFVAPDKPAHMHGNAKEKFKFRNRPLLWPQGGPQSGLYPITNPCPAFRPMCNKVPWLNIACAGARRYKPRSVSTGTPGGSGALHTPGSCRQRHARRATRGKRCCFLST